VVDPQDGTSAFLRGLRGSSVSVALLCEGEPVPGVVHAPTAPDDAGDLFARAEGAALTRNGAGIAPLGDGAGIGEGAVIALNERAADHAAANARALARARVLAVPSIAYRLALAAAGEADAAATLQSVAAWDVAGGHALLRGAGGVLADFSGRPVACEEGAAVGRCIGGARRTVAAVAASGLAGAIGQGHAPRRPARPARRVLSPPMLARAQGALLGQLAGDALGSLVEFRPAREIRAACPGGVRELRDGGHRGILAGQPTDDSEMALALARSIVREGGFDAARIGALYLAWRDSRPFDIGETTADGIRAIAAGRPARSESQANGALMRVSPVGIFAAGRPALAARVGAADAGLTRPHPVCRAAASAFAAAFAAGIAGADAEGMWAAAHAHAGERNGADKVRGTLEAARRCPPEHFQTQMRWVRIALGNAFHRLLSGAPLEEAVIATVSEGGDTDTNAAICGALLGALQGREAVPLRWRRALPTCRPGADPAARRLRPKDYWPDDAADLAEALLAAGEG
jgi:ADP-ribosylglycohydrolase